LHRFGARKNDFAGSPGPNLYVLNGILYGTAGTSKHGWGTFTNSDGGAGNIWAYQGALYGRRAAAGWERRLTSLFAVHFLKCSRRTIST
jgi:hypothetical protein